MQVHTFIAESAPDAVAQIRETLGSEAVVLNVRRLPAEGLARLWQKPRIEVLAHVPEKIVAPVQAAPVLDAVQVSALAELRAEMAEMRGKLSESSNLHRENEIRETNTSPRPSPHFAPPAPQNAERENHAPQPDETARLSLSDPDTNPGDWRVGSLLEQTGLLPAHAESIVAELCARHGTEAPVSIATEIDLAKQVLAEQWKSSPTNTNGVHVFIGAPGSGKTTALCKWLAQVSLVEGRSAEVWRLDGHIANTAEQLSVFGEIFGVKVERFAPANGELPDADVLFVDLPGVNHTDANAIAQLSQRIADIPGAQVHLVVNGAYETSLLLAQVRAFSELPVADVIVTHLDEEPRWGKIWNLVLGTSCRVRQFGTGQNIPGDFVAATAEYIFSHQFPKKSAETHRVNLQIA
jgi:flagellar biosynthesis protein FlhF